ncbi:MAG TPA: hypothetical protein VK153_02360 [Candidatus Paceibacterota bacterium]|nr:hypothetical protein [Candidatus Paceibacterota bacterium]
MNNNPIVLFLDKKGRYLCPEVALDEINLGRSNLEINGLTVDPFQFHPFGLAKSYPGDTVNYADDSEPTKQIARFEAHKRLINRLKEEAERLELGETAYVLVEIKQDQDAGKYWCLTAEYQFMLKRS